MMLTGEVECKSANCIQLYNIIHINTSPYKFYMLLTICMNIITLLFSYYILKKVQSLNNSHRK